MPTLSFEGETNDEIVQKVRRWLASTDGEEHTGAGITDVINQSAELTKDALSVIANAAPGPIAESDVVKALTSMGYKATEATRQATLSSLDSLETATGGSVVQNIAEQGTKAMWKMNSTIAKQFLKAATKD
jgi:hypothetical protein